MQVAARRSLAAMLFLCSVLTFQDVLGTPAPAYQVTEPNDVPVPDNLFGYVDPGYSWYEDGIWMQIEYPDAFRLLPEFDVGDLPGVADPGQYAGWRAAKIRSLRDNGVEGPLVVTARQLDGDAPDAVDVAFDAQRQFYGTTGFTPVVLAFAAPGCWEITATVGEHISTFVADVVFVNELGTPEASPVSQS